MDNAKQILSQEESLELINSKLDSIIQENNQNGYFSKHFNTFKNTWNKYKYARLTTGIALTSGVAIATVSGALAIAGTLIATRAAISAIGGFIATDAVFDIINEKTTKDSLEKLLVKAKNVTDKNELEELIQKTLKDIEDNSKEEIINKIETTQKKINKKNTIKNLISTAAGVGIGIIGGSKILEMTTTPGTKEIISSVQNKVSNILPSNKIITMNKPINGDLIKDIFNDIKNDHPKQGYVTIEQSVRRIEGLRNGIGLDESVKLKQFNASIAEQIRKPDSDIIKTAKNLGYMKDGQNFDDVAKRLTQEKIEKILVKTYENNPITIKEVGDIPLRVDIADTSAKIVTNNIIEKVPEAGITSGNRVISTGAGIAGGLGSLYLGKKITNPDGSFKKLIKNEWEKTVQGNKDTYNQVKDFLRKDYERTNQLEKDTSDQVKDFLKKDYEKTVQLDKKTFNQVKDFFGRLIFGKDTYNLRKNKHAISPIYCGNTESNSKNTQSNGGVSNAGIDNSIKSSNHNENQIHTQTPSRTQNTSRINTIINDEEENGEIVEINETAKQKDFINKRLKLFLIINNKFGFNLDSSTYKESNDSYSILATKKTIGGEFAITVDCTSDNIKLKIHWFDHGECKFQKEIQITQVSVFEENKFVLCLEKALTYLFRKSLLERDKIKNKEYRDNFHTVEISRNDFASIYRQIREPYVVNHDTETCGYWFQSIYDLNNGILRMHNLQNPKLHTELKVTGGMCEILPPIDGNWDNQFTNRNIFNYLQGTFDNYELKHLINLSSYKTEEEKNSGRWITKMSGKCYFFNWHKHPDSYIEPSSADLGNSGQVKYFKHFLPLPVITFGIAVKKEAYLRKYGHLYPNAVEIKGRDYGGNQDYIMSYWKVLKQEGVSEYSPSRDLIPVNIKVVD